MIWWVTITGKVEGEERQLFYVVEAPYEDEALIRAQNMLGVKMLDEVTEVNAVRST